ncbi:MAG: helix-turn-helix transcriptional regulator [Clostridia bacterium]|nr:helix-turn-helix transcriptional regulator [Clostridia bacterium]MBR2944279.1 helix-turn-helix transcriptional regulator [Clostridia bacterium]
MYKEDFSLRLARLRDKKNVSARDMSLSIGQNPGYINNIESGKALPSMSVFFCICEYLGVTPSEFFETEVKSPEAIRNITEDLMLLDEASLGSIAQIVKKLSNK